MGNALGVNSRQDGVKERAASFMRDCSILSADFSHWIDGPMWLPAYVRWGHGVSISIYLEPASALEKS
jgi:hypothetical protein